VNFDVDINTYTLSLVGLVTIPMSLSYEQIMSYPSVTQNVEIVCPGTFEEWHEWTGIPLSAIFKDSGLAPGAAQVGFTGVDGYLTEVPLETLLQNNAFLAYKMDGAVLPTDRGYPFRLVVPGTIGGEWMRWVTKMEVFGAPTAMLNPSLELQTAGAKTLVSYNKLCACAAAAVLASQT
jgi:DMSO/TMAO reductase YedYZ molybdopterin-dependent catalytic subunit